MVRSSGGSVTGLTHAKHPAGIGTLLNVVVTREPRLRRVLVAASAGLFAIQLDFFAMQAALPAMASDLSTSIDSMQWVISGYMLSLASFFVAGGRLADIFGRRRWLIIGAAVFGVASLAGGAAPNATVVIAMRVVQGVGGAILFTVALAVVTNAFSSALVQRAIGLVFGISAVGEALGPLAGGFFTEFASWRWVLWINVPVCIAIIVLVMTSVEDSRDTEVSRVDWSGLALIVSSIGLFTFGVDQSSDWGWSSPATLGLIGLALVLLVLFIFVELRVDDPLVDLILFKTREFTVMVVAGTVGNVAVVVAIFISMIYLQTERGFSPLEAGVAFLAFSSGVAIASQLSGRLGDFRSSEVMATALLVGGLGSVGMGLAVDHTAAFFALSIVGGIGLGLTFSFANVVTQSIVGPAQAGAASGVVMTVLVAAGGVGVTVAAAVANTAVQQGPGAGLDDVIRGIFVAAGSIAVLCAPLVWLMGRASTTDPFPAPRDD